MILFVDDEKRGIESYKEELDLQLKESLHTERTEWAGNVDDALLLFEERAAEISLLVLDIMMPPGKSFGMDETQQGRRTGERFYERVRQRAPDLPVMILTNVRDPRVIERFRAEDENKCRFFRKKRVLPFEFAEEVLNFLARRQSA